MHVPWLTPAALSQAWLVPQVPLFFHVPLLQMSFSFCALPLHASSPSDEHEQPSFPRTPVPVVAQSVLLPELALDPELDLDSELDLDPDLDREPALALDPDLDSDAELAPSIAVASAPASLLPLDPDPLSAPPPSPRRSCRSPRTALHAIPWTTTIDIAAAVERFLRMDVPITTSLQAEDHRPKVLPSAQRPRSPPASRCPPSAPAGTSSRHRRAERRLR